MSERDQAMMMRKRNKRKHHLWIAAVVILLLAITDTATYRITEQYIRGKGNMKEIAYKGSDTVSIKNVIKKLNPAPFKIDRQLVKQIKNVMIIAYPNGETLWVGGYIMKDRHLIICLINGNNKIRKKEFEKAAELTGNYGIIFNYPNNPKHVKNNWRKAKGLIRNDIDYVLSYKKWDSIVTHNPDGEYGHIQYKFTSITVTNECVEPGLMGKLGYFGKFYKINCLLNHTIPSASDSQDVQAKENLMSEVYLSQGYAHRVFSHTVLYERFIQCKDWYFGF